MTVYYPSLAKLRRVFAPEFSIRSVKGIGVAVPPSYIQPLVRAHPRWLNAAVAADRVLGRCRGLRLLADHILITFERRAHAEEALYGKPE